MQSIQFIKEGLQRYMAVPCTGVIKEGYRSELLQRREIPYFLQYEVRECDGNRALYYRLHHHTTLKAVLGHIPFTLYELKNMLSSIIGAIESVEDYLLYHEGIIWRTDQVFIEVDSGNLQFCYNPVQGEDNGEFKDFLSELIQLVGKKDEEVVVQLLQFYNFVTEPECTLEQLLEYRKIHLEQETVSRPFYKKESKKEASERLVREEELSPVDWSIQEPQRKKEKIIYDLIVKVLRIILVLLSVGNLTLFIFLMTNVLTYSYMKDLFIGLAVLVVVALFYFYFSSSETEEEIMQEYFANSSMQILKKSSDKGRIRYGETCVLKEGKDVSGKEIVVEDGPVEWSLIALVKDSFPPILIEKDSIIVGCMKEGCDYTIEGRGVSRMHAKLMKKQDELYLLDLNSTNGTRINGELLESGKDYRLAAGDIVAFAYVEFLVGVKK